MVLRTDGCPRRPPCWLIMLPMAAAQADLVASSAALAAGAPGVPAAASVAASATWMVVSEILLGRLQQHQPRPPARRARLSGSQSERPDSPARGLERAAMDEPRGLLFERRGPAAWVFGISIYRNAQRQRATYLLLGTTTIRYPTRGIVIIRKAQLEPAAKAAAAAFEQEMVNHLFSFSPKHCEVIKEPGVREVIRLGLQRAEAFGFTFRGPVRLFIELMFMFGSEFATDPQHPWAAAALQDKTVPDRCPVRTSL